MTAVRAVEGGNTQFLRSFSLEGRECVDHPRDDQASSRNLQENQGHEELSKLRQEKE